MAVVKIVVHIEFWFWSAMPQQGVEPGQGTKKVGKRCGLPDLYSLLSIVRVSTHISTMSSARSISIASMVAKRKCKATLAMTVKAMAPSDCGYDGCLFQHCMNDNVCPKATAKLLKSMDYARLCLIALLFRPQSIILLCNLSAQWEIFMACWFRNAADCGSTRKNGLMPVCVSQEERMPTNKERSSR